MEYHSQRIERDLRRGSLTLGIPYDGFLVVFFVFHIGYFLFFFLADLDFARLAQGPDIPHPSLLAGSHTSSPQPTVVVPARGVPSASPLAELILHHGFILSGISGKVVVQAPMTGYPAGDEVLFSGGEVGNTFSRRRGIGPGPGGEFVDEVVAGEEELFGGDLAGGTEGGVVGYGGEAVTEGVEGGVEEVHYDAT